MKTVVVSLSCIVMVCLSQLCLAQDIRLEQSLVDKCNEHVRQRAKMTEEVISALTNELKALKDMDMAPAVNPKEDPKGWSERNTVRYEHARRVERIADFLSEVRAIEAIPVLVEYLDTMGSGATDVSPRGGGHWGKLPCALALLRIGVGDVEHRQLLWEIISLPPNDERRLRVAALVLIQIYGDEGAYAMLQRVSQNSAATCDKLRKLLLEASPQLKAKRGGGAAD